MGLWGGLCGLQDNDGKVSSFFSPWAGGTSYVGDKVGTWEMRLIGSMLLMMVSRIFDRVGSGKKLGWFTGNFVGRLDPSITVHLPRPCHWQCYRLHPKPTS